MKKKDGVIYYGIKETSTIYLNVTPQTLRSWIKINERMIEVGKEGIIPNPTMINNIQCFNDEDIEVIKQNVKRFKAGEFKQYREIKTTYTKLKEENVRLRKEIDRLKGGKIIENN